jgi:tetratricopeptide (TPR) repeat protein
VQAYSFTSAPIAAALVDAHRRRVNVRVILDSSQRSERYSSATFLRNMGIPVLVDDAHAIAHNKLMIIDGRTVITGSFNFTKAAEERNAENVVIMEDPRVAAKYLSNWTEHAKHSVPYVQTAKKWPKPIEENDRHLEAAEGWLELGNYLEANEELERISPVLRAHPEVLRVRWKVYAAAKEWDGAFAIAQTLTDKLPGLEQHWLFLAAALHGMGKTQEAYETVCGVMNEFGQRPAIPYQAACYAAELGELFKANEWLDLAIEVGGDEIEERALLDAALKPLWDRIRER